MPGRYGRWAYAAVLVLVLVLVLALLRSRYGIRNQIAAARINALPKSLKTTPVVSRSRSMRLANHSTRVVKAALNRLSSLAFDRSLTGMLVYKSGGL